MSATRGPLDGLRALEVSLGVSSVGAGIASSLPGSLLRDLGADVARVQSAVRPTLDAGTEFFRTWNRGKDVTDVASGSAADVVRSLAQDADVVFLAGSEWAIEGQGIGAHQLERDHPRLVGVRVRPSMNALGSIPDLELLVAARAGLPTQLRGHEAGRPAFPDLAVGQVGAGLSAAVGALAGLYQRERTGVGCWAETSLYDGMLAILPMIIGRVEHPSPSTRLLWQDQGPEESVCYQCADGDYVQLWFGAKGAYEAFLEHMGEPPSEEGYSAELMSGSMVERGARWAARFATQDRAWWVADLAGQNFRCEAVLRPGEALLDAHLREVGLAIEHEDPDRGPLTVIGPVVRVTATGGGRATPPDRGDGPFLDGVRVLDLSAYLAGPVAPLILAELGADVVKVEQPTGDVHRNMQPLFAAGQRGKRSVALDLKGPDAGRILERLFRWSDVVHQNSRIGLAERLGYDEATVRAANPDVVYSFSSGFGDHGPRALLPANDQLIQAVAGVEHAQAGYGQAPRFLTWGAVDVSGGWLAACGILAALYARRRTGVAQSVRNSLLGAGLVLKFGAFVAGDTVVGGPVLDGRQLGYGAAYRLYQGGDGSWFALAIPDVESWERLREVVGLDELPTTPPPLRTETGELQPEETLLEQVFGTKDAAAWVAALLTAGVPTEPVPDADRAAFCDRFLDDPVNRQLGRVLSYQWGSLGRFDQPSNPPRMGPVPQPGAGGYISSLGEHTAEVLGEVGIDDAERAGFAASGAVPPG